MRIARIMLTLIFFFSYSVFTSGCWNYREIDQLSVVAGVAIDKGIHEKYSITVELVDVVSGKEQQTKSKTVTMEGKSIFEAVRNEISLIGNRIYWSHAKVLIISEEIAREGIIEAIDWFNRDAETRSDIQILVAKGRSAVEILKTKGLTEEVTSFELDEILANERSVSNAPVIEAWKFTNIIASEGVGAIAGVVDLKEDEGKYRPYIMGTAIFRNDKLVGFIDGDETKYMLFVQNELKGGVLVEEIKGDDHEITIALEIFKNRTKIKPVINDDGNIEMHIKVEVKAAIDELGGTKNVIEGDKQKELERMAEETLKKGIENIIKKVQKDFDVDIFGFGIKIRQDCYDKWKLIAKNWEVHFKKLKVYVETKVDIKNSAMLSKPLKIGE